MQEYAPDTLRSLAVNARDDFEFLLVNDCARDATPEILERFAPRLPNARVIHHEVNRGLAGARNTGLDAAQGRYIAFLDGDDWLGPGYLEQLLAAIERHGCDFIRVDHVQVTGRKRVIHRAPEARRNQVLDPRDSILPADQSTMVDYPYAWAGVFDGERMDRELLRFDAQLRTAEDRPWIWRLHRKAESYAVVSLHGLFYRRGISSSLTQIGDIRQLDFIASFDTVLAELADDPEVGRLMPKAVRTYCAIIAHHLKNSERYEPEVARRLRTMAREALDSMDQDVLKQTFDAMPPERRALLGRLRGRVRTAVSL
ncbi:glycosyltransferase involved in cell wall biosynthesis [Allostreptomyces psammosilenae]|uniref:Glycosyltransferase involved in cell wall biosynthesis n=1 Tax=Allostreptomyces psammosilenae TaxID=1892865 RepID=A0A852ZUQ7_9ACTN|nr:glycosyltransferase involved in cell wall biosynthesis [Allostreptomyces psammosilenae]